MAASNGETVSLRTEVAALRLRVLELERENRRLAQIASSSSCVCKPFVLSCSDHHTVWRIHRTQIGHEVSDAQQFRMDNFPSTLVADASLYGCDQEVQNNGKSHESRTSGHDCNVNGEGHDGLPEIQSKRANRAGHQVGVLSHCQKRLVALKIMYFGQRFYGFASEAHTEPTVESEIFKVLERARLLVGSRKESCYSRCGRTDKGVSATGQGAAKEAVAHGRVTLSPALDMKGKVVEVGQLSLQ